MTNQTKAKWTTRLLNWIAVLGIIFATAALVRDYQTRGLIDRPARDAARALCKSDNGRWNAYLTTVTEIANRRSPGESDADYAARKARSDKIIEQISAVVTVDCEQEIQ